MVDIYFRNFQEAFAYFEWAFFIPLASDSPRYRFEELAPYPSMAMTKNNLELSPVHVYKDSENEVYKIRLRSANYCLASGISTD